MSVLRKRGATNSHSFNSIGGRYCNKAVLTKIKEERTAGLWTVQEAPANLTLSLFQRSSKFVAVLHALYPPTAEDGDGAIMSTVTFLFCDFVTAMISGIIQRQWRLDDLVALMACAAEIDADALVEKRALVATHAAQKARMAALGLLTPMVRPRRAHAELVRSPSISPDDVSPRARPICLDLPRACTRRDPAPAPPAYHPPAPRRRASASASCCCPAWSRPRASA